MLFEIRVNFQNVIHLRVSKLQLKNLNESNGEELSRIPWLRKTLIKSRDSSTIDICKLLKISTNLAEDSDHAS